MQVKNLSWRVAVSGRLFLKSKAKVQNIEKKNIYNLFLFYILFKRLLLMLLSLIFTFLNKYIIKYNK